MDKAINTTGSPARKGPDLIEIESGISDLVRLTRIADDIIGRTLDLQNSEEYAPGYRKFILADDQLEDVCFLLCEAQYRARLLSEAFYAKSEAGR